MKKELTKKQKETLAKKERIYDIAIQLFKKYGYDNTSIRDICKEANVTTGTLYNLYESKVSILFQFKEKLEENANDPLDVKHINIDDPADTLTKYTISILTLFQNIGADMAHNLHINHSLIWNNESEDIPLLEQFVKQCQDHGTMTKILDAKKTAEAINIIIYGLIYQWCDNNGDYDLIQKSQELLPLFYKSFIIDDRNQ